MRIKVAMLQINPDSNNQGENLKKGIEFCRQAKDMDADIILFPEMWNIGYTPPSDEAWEDAYNEEYLPQWAEWKLQAVDRESDFISSFRELSRELEVAICITYLEKWPDFPRNSMTIFNRFGEEILTYAKVHTCDWGMEGFCTPGDEFRTALLDTIKGEINIGAMICYDREFPESARVLMLKGSELVLVPNACVIEDNRFSQLKARAFENMFGIAMANYPSPKENGRSVAISPVCFGEKGESLNTIIMEAGKEEGIYVAEFDMDKIREYRENETWGNAYRKPHTYSQIISKEIKHPFIRKKHRKIIDK